MKRLLILLLGVSVLALAAGGADQLAASTALSAAGPALRPVIEDALRARMDAEKQAELDATRAMKLAEEAMPTDAADPGYERELDDPDAYVVIGTGTNTHKIGRAHV